VIDTFSVVFRPSCWRSRVTGALGIGLTNGMIAVGIVMFPGAWARHRPCPPTLIVRQELYVDASRGFWRAGLAHPVGSMYCRTRCSP